MKTFFYLTIVLFLSYQCAFADTYTIDSDTLDLWYSAGCAEYKRNDCVKTLEYFYTLRLIDYGKHLKNKHEIINYIDSIINDCEGKFNFSNKHLRKELITIKGSSRKSSTTQKVVIEGTSNE